MGSHGTTRFRERGFEGEAMSHPILDPQAIARLHRIGGAALVGAMLESFEVNAAARVRSARDAAAAGDARALADAAHSLKSSAGNVGATSLQLEAQAVERQALEADAPLDQLATALEEQFTRAREAVAAARRTQGS